MMATELTDADKAILAKLESAWADYWAPSVAAPCREHV